MNHPDPMHVLYADMDFSEAKPVREVPHLARLQAEHGGKSRITLRVDNDEQQGGRREKAAEEGKRRASAKRAAMGFW